MHAKLPSRQRVKSYNCAKAIMVPIKGVESSQLHPSQAKFWISVLKEPANISANLKKKIIPETASKNN